MEPARTDGMRTRPRSAALRRFAALFAVGLVGIVSAMPLIVDLVADVFATLPEAPELPFAVVVALALVNPLLLLALATVVGLLCAPRVGLRSRFAERMAGAPIGWPEVFDGWRIALVVGAGLGVALVALDALTLPLLGAGGAALSIVEGRTLLVTVAGVLYGGVTEEILVRWGLMSFLVWALWRVLGRGSDRPEPALVWTAIAIAAVAFGALHLPTVAAVVELTTAVVLRTLLLNAIGGVAFGWLYWRRGLEAAMVAHAMAHVAMSLAALAVVR
jgi:hypothetical protein